MKWKKAYEVGDIILADRYTTSNMVHQAVKLTDREERESFLDWLWDFEFNKLGLPVPDKVVFLDMNPEVADQLIAARAAAQAQERDIHERDKEYLPCGLRGAGQEIRLDARRLQRARRAARRRGHPRRCLRGHYAAARRYRMKRGQGPDMEGPEKGIL